MNNDLRQIVKTTLSALTLCASFVAVAGPQPTTDAAIQQLQLAETATREARAEGAKKPPREVRKADHDAKKSNKREPKKVP